MPRNNVVTKLQLDDHWRELLQAALQENSPTQRTRSVIHAALAIDARVARLRRENGGTDQERSDLVEARICLNRLIKQTAAVSKIIH
jgi:hypothetical protein